jgi:Ni/Fe-hydrogenase subunit HybB-like protein
MRAFLADLDREVVIAGVVGLVVGGAWLAWTGPGFLLACAALLGGAVAWIARRRWIEVGALMLAAGAVPAAGYRLVGPPDVPPRQLPDSVQIERFAPGTADLLVVAGIVSIAVVAVLTVREGRRRDRLIAGKEERRRARLEGGA